MARVPDKGTGEKNSLCKGIGAGNNLEGGECGQGSSASIRGPLRSQGSHLPQYSPWLGREGVLECRTCEPASDWVTTQTLELEEPKGY